MNETNKKTALRNSPIVMEHRSDLEGMRGIAVLSVVFFHFETSMLSGGFIGVDVFFVLSGFLITGILLRDLLESGSVRLANFWGRRARRILPAAALVLIATAVASLFLVSPVELGSVGRDISAAGYYGFNWRAAARSIDYLDSAEDRTPVLHYWSLAVEEQFYLIWPLLILGLFRLSMRTAGDPLRSLLAASVFIWAVSFALCVYFTSANQPFAFFGTLTRAWQLLTGASIAIWLALGFDRSRTGSEKLALLGMAALVAGFVFTTPEASYPGYLSLLPTLGTGALILAGSANVQPWISHVLSAAPLTFIGRVSYSWYLWHWPILLLGREIWPSDWPAGGAILLILSFIAAVATYYLVENPIRYSPRLVSSPRRSLIVGVALTVVTVGAGLGVLNHARGLRIYLSDKSSILVASVARDRSPAYQTDCHLSLIETQHADCVFGTKGAKPSAVLLGDSHAAHLFNAVEEAALSTGTAFLMRSKSACPALDGRVWNTKFGREYFECQAWLEGVLAEVKTLRPKLVILSSASVHLLIDAGQRPAPQEAQIRLRVAAERKMVLELLKYAARVAIVRDTPRLPENPLVCLYQHPENETACTWKLSDLLSPDNDESDLADLYPRVAEVDLNPLICPAGLCRAVTNGKVIMYDESHVTASFSADLRPPFEALLRGSRV